MTNDNNTLEQQEDIATQPEKKKNDISISAKSFITALIVIFALMVVCYILTFIIPAGQYGRDESGKIVADSFEKVKGGIPFWKWALSPFLVLGGEGNVALIAVIAFLIVIGGVFNSLNNCGLIAYMLGKLTMRFKDKKYLLMALIILFFMALGSVVGSFEEVVPLVPIIVALAIGLGWDVYTGISMSLLAVGCGFAAGVSNPFTVGVAQQIAGLRMFSGAWLRMLAFCLIYALLFAFTYFRAKKIEKPIKENPTFSQTKNSANMNKATICFVTILGVGIVSLIASSFISFLKDYTMIIVAVMFLIAGIVSCLVAKMGGKKLGKTFLSGALGILPAVLMILMASSIKYTLQQANILDTILYGAENLAGNIPKWSIILFIYLLVLVMNFFIPSGSAKAFMLIPIIVPIAEMFGISTQLCIVAFAFGDGFSNVMYPTNAALLISLGLVDVSYVDWFKKSWLFQLCNLVLTSLILLFGFWIGYH